MPLVRCTSFPYNNTEIGCALDRMSEALYINFQNKTEDLVRYDYSVRRKSKL